MSTPALHGANGNGHVAGRDTRAIGLPLVLVVDDEPANLATLRQILSADYRLVYARSGTEALAAAKKHRPALVLLDIEMPDMNGYAVCRRLKADPATENVPVIFVSARGDVGDESAGFECGGVDYIVKPVSPALVRARVRTHLSLVRASLLERYVHELETQQIKIDRLSRIRTILSDINFAIMRVRERKALLDEACRIAVERGGFGTAWIALAGQAAAALGAAACQGIEADRFDALLDAENRAAGGEHPGAPSRVAAAGVPVCCNNLHAGPSADDPTCADALAHDFASLIALPLGPAEHPVGVMVLYAYEAEFFDEIELKLLGEFAGDISFALKHIEQAERVDYLSFYDDLTGLPNATLFRDRLGQLIQAATHEGGGAFVAMIDLHRFKQLNDTYGRHVGDQVLRAVGERLAGGLSRPCTAARIAADTFALVAPCAGDEDVSTWVGELEDLLERPLAIDGGSLPLPSRLGIAVFPHDGRDAETLYTHAETALKQAKASGERRSFFSAELNDRMADKFELERLLALALDAHQFELHFQPKIDLATGAIVGAEALIRWRHPVRGLLSPLEFIPLAEESGLIVPIGGWVIDAVCEQQSLWRGRNTRIVPVALNLSAPQFRTGNLHERVQDALARNGLAPSTIELELTESLLMHNLHDVERSMHQFHAMGLQLSLDDFGTGYSSLAYLKHLPFDTVKIDRAFVTDVTTSADDAALSTAIIAIAHGLRMHVVAEGVETREQADFLRDKDCDQMQGYLFSRPVPARDFERMLQEGRRFERRLATA